MKVYVITRHFISNYGSFLQTFATQRVIERMSHEVKIIDYRRRDEGTVYSFKVWMKRHSKGLFKGILYFFVKYLELKCADLAFTRINRRYFKLTRRFSSEKELNEIKFDADVFCSGSDTILEEIAREEIGIMWGCKNTNAAQVFFAASGDSCSRYPKDSSRFPEIYEIIKKFKFIGLRDNIIKQIFVKSIGIPKEKIHLQPDPTYLLPLSIFNLSKRQLNAIESLRKPICLFHFDRRFKFRKELAKAIKNMGYCLITPEYDPNCDLSLKVMSPFEWGALFKYCDIVVTERFHDTVFALRHEKPIFNIDWKTKNINQRGYSKRSELLSLYNLDEQNYKIFSIKDVDIVITKISQDIQKFKKEKVSLKNDELIKLSEELLLQIQSLVSTKET